MKSKMSLHVGVVMGILLLAAAAHADAPPDAGASVATVTSKGTAVEPQPVVEGTAPGKALPPVNAPPPVRVPTADIVRANLEPSYLTFPVILSGIDPLVFETSVAPHFSLTPPGLPVALVLTPKIVLRMFQGHSTPVKTPSYMPQLALFAWFERTFTGEPVFYSSLALVHHSNGQAGPFLNPDGTNNHENGSFATNYVELSVYRAGWKPKLLDWTRLSFEWHTPFGQELGPGGRYGLVRLHAATTVFVHLFLEAKLTVELTSILDHFERASTHSVVRQLERFPVSAQYLVKIPGIDVGLYLGYYFGQDYYNIWFDRLANVFQVGIGADVAPSLSREL